MSTPHTELERAAKAFHSAGVFGKPNDVTLDQVMVIMYLNDADGNAPGGAVRDYSLIGKRPAKKAEAMLRAFVAAGGKVEWHESSAKVSDATFSHPAGGALRIVWDMDRVKSSRISNPVYSTYPAQMLRARAVSEGCRGVYPASTGGVYTPEELNDMPAGAPEKEHRAALEVPEALLEAAKETAAKGTEAFRAYWKALAKADRVILAGKLDEFEQDAKAADAEAAKALAAPNAAKAPAQKPAGKSTKKGE